MFHIWFQNYVCSRSWGLIKIKKVTMSSASCFVNTQWRLTDTYKLLEEAVASSTPKETRDTTHQYKICLNPVMNQKSKFLNTCSPVIHSFHRCWAFGKHYPLVWIFAAAPQTALGNHNALSSTAFVRLLVPDAFACLSPLIPGYILLLRLRLADVKLYNSYLDYPWENVFHGCIRNNISSLTRDLPWK